MKSLRHAFTTMDTVPHVKTAKANFARGAINRLSTLRRQPVVEALDSNMRDAARDSALDRLKETIFDRDLSYIKRPQMTLQNYGHTFSNLTDMAKRYLSRFGMF